MKYTLGIIPVSRVGERCRKAPGERSREFSFKQVMQVSEMVTVTVAPLFVLVILTCDPQRLESVKRAISNDL